MKRYDGSTGTVYDVPEPRAFPPPPPGPPPPRPAGPHPPAGGFLPGFDPGRLLAGLGGLETEDLLLLLILWLLYRESGDPELLVIMAAMYLF